MQCVELGLYFGSRSSGLLVLLPLVGTGTEPSFQGAAAAVVERQELIVLSRERNGLDDAVD